ncbi:MAG TPA: hypothetical protein PKW38_03890, partial [Paludibacteraceae bacterium]|nr:hypothetical protein [Paludibacteraceae bacterium]
HVLWPTELCWQVGKLSTSHRSTNYPCCGQALGDSKGADRIGLTHRKSNAFCLIDQESALKNDTKNHFFVNQHRYSFFLVLQLIIIC